MSISNPLTVSSDIQRVEPPTLNIQPKTNPLKANLGVFSADILEISKQGLAKQRTEAQLGSRKEVQKIANEVVSVSSSVGSPRSVSNLSSEQAIALYNRISSFF